jgi:hypothetical protein
MEPGITLDDPHPGWGTRTGLEAGPVQETPSIEVAMPMQVTVAFFPAYHMLYDDPS